MAITLADERAAVLLIPSLEFDFLDVHNGYPYTTLYAQINNKMKLLPIFYPHCTGYILNDKTSLLTALLLIRTRYCEREVAA